MEHHSFLFQALIYLSAAVILVPLFKRTGLGSVLGYLAAGSLIGPWGLGIITNVDDILHFAEFGVVLLLFLIGLELEPAKLWRLRKSVFVLGGLQVVVTGALLASIGYFFKIPWSTTLIAGFGLALSSTAFALQTLAEKNQLNTVHGQVSFSILLFQDLAVIPLLAILPLLSSTGGSGPIEWLPILKVVGAIGGIIVLGPYLMNHIFRVIASTKNTELFTATSLLLVIGIALLMQAVGLSMALGAFVAGVLLANSEYRHQLEVDIAPFKGLLMGLFFMAVGMSVDYGLMVDKIVWITLCVAGVIGIKFLVLYGLGRANKLSTESSRNLAITLPQGGEFAFVLFSAAATYHIMDAELVSFLIVVVTLSMVIASLMFTANDLYLNSRFNQRPQAFERIENQEPPVIIAGLGRYGGMISRILRIQKIGFTALDLSSTQVQLVRRFGGKVYYGDASRLDLLTAAGAETAKFFVLSIDDPQSSLNIAKTVKAHFPHLKILARARNRQHAFELFDLGIEVVNREVFDSSLSTAKQLLIELGLPEVEAQRITAQFRDMDESTIREQAQHKDNESELIAHALQATQQFEELLQIDETREAV